MALYQPPEGGWGAVWLRGGSPRQSGIREIPGPVTDVYKKLNCVETGPWLLSMVIRPNKVTECK